MGFEDYQEIVATCASISTIGCMLSGTLTCKDIYRKGSSSGIDPMPFIGGTGMCILMLQYAWILRDSTMINVNVFGAVTNAIYAAVYYYYSPHTKSTLASMGKVAALVMALLGYAQLEDPNNIEIRFGLIVTVLFLLLIAAPFAHLGKIIQTKNTDILNFPLIFMGTLVSFQWLLYGLIINNSFLIFQNAVFFTLSSAQLSLFAMFPSKPSTAVSDERKKD